MSDYTPNTDFSAKDALTSGDPEKAILGADVDAEFDAISTAIATKYDSGDIATTLEAQAEASNIVLMTPGRVADWADANAGIVGDFQGLTDPGADRLVFWDDSASAGAWLTMGAGLSTSGTTISVDHDAATNFVANEHVNHTSVSILAGTGLTGGGTIASSRTLSLSHLGIQSLTDPGADRILFWDDSVGATGWLTVGSNLSLSGTTLSVSTSGLNADMTDGYHASESVTGSTLAARNSSGYLFAGYFNQNSSPESVTVGNFFVENNSSDGYLRKISKANAMRNITLSWTIATDPGTTPTGTAGDVFAYY